ncbi:hypothetical protein RJ640_002481 [Escallonia rubra]|uniref:Pentatricopeptide repeat-containing protein n=1 Tax=Escallonia rubra TaxID=112253 RepID=A0AA88S4B4_9ASTE|nr:hypothetical protein RJ640_002481 [Escallonia rubra]
MDGPVMCSNNSKKNPKSDEFGNMSKSVMVINALNLGVALGNKAHLAAFNKAIIASFDFENPFRANNFLISSPSPSHFVHCSSRPSNLSPVDSAPAAISSPSSCSATAFSPETVASPEKLLRLLERLSSWSPEDSPATMSMARLLFMGGELGRQAHCLVLKMGFDSGSVHVQSALIDMYGKCGYIDGSVSVFEDAPNRMESYNSLMTSLLQCGIVEDVVELFGLMVDEGLGFDEVSLSTTLKALTVSIFASLATCTLLYCCAIKSGFESDIAVSCSLIDVYSRSGHVKLSSQVFEELPSANTICYTSIINAYARNGMGMQQQAQQP